MSEKFLLENYLIKGDYEVFFWILGMFIKYFKVSNLRLRYFFFCLLLIQVLVFTIVHYFPKIFERKKKLLMKISGVFDVLIINRFLFLAWCQRYRVVHYLPKFKPE